MPVVSRQAPRRWGTLALGGAVAAAIVLAAVLAFSAGGSAPAATFAAAGAEALSAPAAPPARGRVAPPFLFAQAGAADPGGAGAEGAATEGRGRLRLPHESEREVQLAMRQLVPLVRQCEGKLGRELPWGTSVVAEFVLAPGEEGVVVAEPRILRSNGGDDALAECVLETISGATLAGVRLEAPTPLQIPFRFGTEPRELRGVFKRDELGGPRRMLSRPVQPRGQP